MPKKPDLVRVKTYDLKDLGKIEKIPKLAGIIH